MSRGREVQSTAGPTEPVTRSEGRKPLAAGIVGAVASTLGVFFSAYSTHDYALHLDRQLHGTHCSFIPGVGGATSGDNACTAAMYSPFSALFKDRLWGGVPISLFGLGVYAMFLALSVYLLVAGANASRRARQAYFAASLLPLVASIVMFTISITKLGALCKLCVGVYVASGLLAVAGVLALLSARDALATRDIGPTDRTVVDPEPWHLTEKARARSGAVAMPQGSWLAFVAVFAAVGVAAIAPALVYVATLPNYDKHLVACGKLTSLTDKHNALVKIPTTKPVQPALTFEDPLCPTCKAFHDRLTSEGIYEQLDLTVAIFPLDSECNQMLDKPLHPGACVLARAFLCGDEKGNARQVLEWSYANQEELTEAGKAGNDLLRAKVKGRFPELDACLDAKSTNQRLERVLQFAIANKVRVSTPQLYLGETRVCDEDTDMGLSYAVGQLAPQVKR